MSCFFSGYHPESPQKICSEAYHAILIQLLQPFCDVIVPSHRRSLREYETTQSNVKVRVRVIRIRVEEEGGKEMKGRERERKKKKGGRTRQRKRVPAIKVISERNDLGWGVEV